MHTTSAAMADKSGALPLPGVNLPSGSFGSDGDVLGRDYIYPTRADIDAWAAQGFKLIRLGFLGRRLLKPDGSGGFNTTADLDILVDLVDYASTKDMSVILDMHDYGKTASGKLIGRDEGAVAEFAAAWRKLAEAMKHRANVIFGLMNEPHEQSAAEWLDGANAAIAAIRDVGAYQLVLVPGSYWGGAHDWTKTDNATVMLQVDDPARNVAYEVHQYLDYNSSGTHRTVVSGAGSERLAAFTAWARAHGVRGFLGEFGWADNRQAQREGRALLCYMARNRDVWLGWTYWAAGPWWGDYMFSIEPKDGAARPQMAVLGKFVGPTVPPDCAS